MPDGEYGELVITTADMQAMPLIRYRTGDYTRFLPGPCPCGGVTRRLDRLSRRPAYPDMEALDSALFRLPGLVDYRAAYCESTLCIGIVGCVNAEQILLSAQRLYPGLSCKIVACKRLFKALPAVILANGTLYFKKRLPAIHPPASIIYALKYNLFVYSQLFKTCAIHPTDYSIPPSTCPTVIVSFFLCGALRKYNISFCQEDHLASSWHTVFPSKPMILPLTPALLPKCYPFPKSFPSFPSGQYMLWALILPRTNSHAKYHILYSTEDEFPWQDLMFQEKRPLS